MALRAAALSLCCLIAFAQSCAAPGDRAEASQSAIEEIRQQIEKSMAALSAADIDAVSQVWLTSPEISLIHPTGHARGWEEVKAFYGFFGSYFSERKLTARDVVIHVNGDTAWAEFYWNFVAKRSADGSEIQTDGRDTQVYRKVENAWRLVHEHYSGPPMNPQP